MNKYAAYFYLHLLAGLPCFAQYPKLDYSISPWLNNKRAAVSLTFDDGISGQFIIAVPLLDKHNFKATFFVSPKILMSQLNNWQLVQNAALGGHEIANHSLTHPHFDSLTVNKIAEELIESNAIIEENIRPQKSQTHAYPFGEGGTKTAHDEAVRTIIKRYFIGARATRNKEIAYTNTILLLQMTITLKSTAI